MAAGSAGRALGATRSSVGRVFKISVSESELELAMGGRGSRHAATRDFTTTELRSELDHIPRSTLDIGMRFLVPPHNGGRAIEQK